MPDPQPARPSAGDDELDELPAIGGDDEAASDLAIDDAIDDSEGEEIGLDAAVGLDDDASFDDDLDADEPGGEGWETDAAPLEEDPELGEREDEEGGWTDGSEAAEAPGWDGDLDGADDDEASSIRDQGEEGVEERFEPGAGEDDAPVDLPLARGEEELADDLDLEDEAEIETPADDRAEHPALALASIPGARVSWRWLGPDDDAIVAIGGGLAAGRTLYRIAGDRAEPLDDDALVGETATSVARTPEGWLVGLQLGGALRSRDGERFERLETLRRDAGAIEVLAETHGGGTRVWARTRGGGLSRTDDLGATWSRPLVAGAVHAIARAGDGGLVALIGPRHGGALRVMRTADGGRGWRSLGGPTIEAIPDEAELSVVADGPHLAVACDATGVGPFVSSDEGQSWRVLDPIRDAVALATAREPSGVVLYAAVLLDGLDRGLVVRVPLEGGGDPEIAIDLEAVRREHHVTGAGDPEGDQRVHALVAEPDPEGTCLWIASGIGIVRAVVRGGR